MSEQTVTSGKSVSGSTVSSGDILIVSSGGSTVSTTVLDGGSVAVLDGGVISATSISGAAGTEDQSQSVIVRSGGSGVDTTVFHDQFIVLNGASASGVVLNDGGMTVQGTGSATNVTVNSQGNYAVYVDGGTMTNTVINNGGGMVEYSDSGDTTGKGGSSYNTVVNNGGFDVVLSGKSVNETVNAGAYEQVYAHGVASGTTLSGGNLYDAGSALGTTLSGGTLTVEAGGVAVGTQNTSGWSVVESGGVTSGAVISGRAAFQSVASGAVDSASTIANGAKEWLSGTAVNDAVSGVGELHIASGATAANTTVSTHGHEYVSAGAVASGTTVSYQGMDYVDGTSQDATLSTNSLQIVNADGLADHATLSTGAVQYDNGISQNTVLNAGGTEVVGQYGMSFDTTINNGGVEKINASGTGASETVNAGGVLDVLSNGKSYNASVTGGTETVEAGGRSVSTNLLSGSEVVSASGQAINTAVSGGTLLDAGLAEGTTITGGSMTVASGGFASGTTETKGNITVQSGGSTVGTLLSGSQAYETVQAGGVENGATIIRGQDTVAGSAFGDTATTLGKINVLSGGYTSGSTITRHAHETVSAGGTAVGTVLDQQGMDYVYGASVSATVKGGSQQFISAGGTASETTVGSGSTQYDAGRTDHTTLQQGAFETVLSGGVADETTVASGAWLTVDADGEIDETVLAVGGHIDIDSLQYGGVAKAAINGDTLVVTEGDASYTIDLEGDYSDYHAELTEDRDGSTVVTLAKGSEICFLPGTMITTPSGTAAVEDLRIGDEVTAWVDGSPVSHKVTWVGSKRVRAQGGASADLSGHPVRILKDAIAANVPNKDLLVTPEHCLFIDGRFVPTRMLVNGRSVFYDRSISVYDYFHIETENHSVIMADGMLTESYLDTGNRRSFTQHGEVASLGGRQKSWEQDAAAALTVDRATVEPMFRQIADRAIAAGLESHEAAAELTQDADQHLVADNGTVIRQSREAAGRAIFMIPAEVSAVRVVSRTARPSETVGPFVDDRRELGVLVGDVVLYDSRATRSITSHLTQADLDGWQVADDATCRWTAGNGLLMLGERDQDSLALLSIEIRAAGPYLADSTVETAAQFA
ncbi:Hint domain-containing protein [Gluconobacter oxydans]|uniref:Hint domain-containing protein n=1 Tax=Gluconobacter oxydans TaxID=442 RepID=UPI00264A481B|nr:Hint domain-containing protein [Gluconobacter oxydans]WKE48682.1 Hint domain-containing protein [Gluconobacter oxydans]